MCSDENPALDLGKRLLAGEIGGSWAYRADQVKALMEGLFGKGGPSIEQIPFESRSDGVDAEVKLPGRHRQTVLKLVKTLLEALCNHELVMMEALLGDEVCVQWPEGTLAFHPREQLLGLLDERKEDDNHATPEDVRLYSYSELKSVLFRGIPEALDHALGAASGITATAILDGVRIFVVVAPDVWDGTWRARNLPLVGIDAGLVAGARASHHEDEAVRIADRVTRHFLLGHRSHLISLRNQMMNQLWLDRDLIEAEELPRRAQEVELGEEEIVFLGTKMAPLSDLDRLVGNEAAGRIAREARKVWKRPYKQLQPKVVVSQIGVLNPETNEAEPSRQTVALLLRIVDRSGSTEEIRWRLGGLFV